MFIRLFIQHLVGRADSVATSWLLGGWGRQATAGGQPLRVKAQSPPRQRRVPACLPVHETACCPVLHPHPTVRRPSAPLSPQPVGRVGCPHKPRKGRTSQPPGMRGTGGQAGRGQQLSPEPKVLGLGCGETRIRAAPPPHDPPAASGSGQECGRCAGRCGPGPCPWCGRSGHGPAVGAGASPTLRARAPSPARASTFTTWIIRARWARGGAAEGPCRRGRWEGWAESLR